MRLRSFVVMSVFGLMCSGADSRIEADHSTAEDPVVPGTSVRSGQTTSGVTVHLAPDREPFVEGTNRVTISVEPAGHVPRSIDLVAPRMPMHGVVRFPVRQGNGGWAASVEIPMAGKWIVYVNFDDGGDAAAIHFDAFADDSAAGMSHHH